jgi:membrane-bound metal-dependent hydrolase YbcI (DUF457 family)
MPLPVAHGLLGASVAVAMHPAFESRYWRTLWVSALLAICPDFDYALNWLRISGGGWHHGFTHSLLFALSVGLLTALVLREFKIRSVILFCSATVSHTLIDYLMTESRGVALWWPLTNRRYKFRLPNPIDYTWDDTTLRGMVIGLLRISLIELMVFGAILLMVIWIKKATNRGAVVS